MAPVVDVDEGLQVIQRGPIARYRFASRGGEREAWSTALYALTRAKFHPPWRQDRGAPLGAAQACLRGRRARDHHQAVNLLAGADEARP
jgi:hypothetical protein